MKYTDAYIESKDIDWFCKIGDMSIHVASAGGAIPDVVNDREWLRKTQNEVSLLEDIYTDDEITINEQMLSTLERMYGGENKFSRDAYLESFMAMARKGFVSMDRTYINDLKDNRYHFVCWPSSNDKTPSMVSELPIIGGGIIIRPTAKKPKLYKTIDLKKIDFIDFANHKVSEQDKCAVVSK